MKRKFILVLVLFAVLMTVSACSKSPVASDNSQKGAISSASQTPGTRGLRMPDFGQPDRTPDISGVVKSIIGNEATILKIDMKAGRDQNASSTSANENASNTRQAPAISLNGTTRTGAGGGRNFNGGPGGPGGPGGSDTTDRAAMLERIKAMSTGEEKILIPVGIQMLKSSNDATTKQRTMVEATLSDITSDKSVTIWLASSTTDKKVAEFVLIN